MNFVALCMLNLVFLNHMQENKGLVYTQCMLTKRQMDVTFLIGLQGDCQVVNMLVDPISSKKRQLNKCVLVSHCHLTYYQ